MLSTFCSEANDIFRCFKYPVWDGICPSTKWPLGIPVSHILLSANDQRGRQQLMGDVLGFDVLEWDLNVIANSQLHPSPAPAKVGISEVN